MVYLYQSIIICSKVNYNNTNRDGFLATAHCAVYTLYTQTILAQLHTIGATGQATRYLICVDSTIDRISTLACVMTEIEAIYDEYGCTIDITRATDEYIARDTMCLFCDEFLRY